MYVFLFLLLFTFTNNLLCQNEELYRITFTDKNNSAYTLRHPEDFLSRKSIERRLKKGISLTKEDLPVSSAYIDSLREKNIKIICTSRWFNTSVVVFPSKTAYFQTKKCSYVKSIEIVKDSFSFSYFKSGKYEKKYFVAGNFQNFDVDNPVYMPLKLHNGTFLHNKGYKGQGVLIAIIDAGFKDITSFTTLNYLLTSNRIVAQKNFVNDNEANFYSSTHGTIVLAIMAGYIKNSYIGCAPESEYLLLRSEDINAEYPAEEDFWVAAAEFADSMGADIINTSLGYSTFDNKEFDYSYKDMDGNTTLISKGVNKAVEKGMIVIVSAGNFGNTHWHYISAPADAENAITVGAIDTSGNIADFSSRGPTYDGRVKPELVSIGKNLITEKSAGIFGSVNGTSFSTPIITGLTACLLLAFPDADCSAIKNALILSSNNYMSPDSTIGYGIPDFEKAFNILNNIHLQENFSYLYPNPFRDKLFLNILKDTEGMITISCYDVFGRNIFTLSQEKTFQIDLSNHVKQLTNGIFIFKISDNTKTNTFICIKTKK